MALMKTLTLIACCAFVVILAESFAVQIQCYKCDSNFQGNEGCEDPFKANGIPSVNCSGSCMKLKARKGNKQYVARSCVKEDLRDKCDDAEKDGVKSYNCYCNTDYCNTGTTPGVSMAMTLTAMIGRLLFSINY